MLSARNALVNLRSVTFASLVIIFVAISVLVASGATSNFDSSVTDSIVRAAGNPIADTAMIVVSESASIFPSPMFIFALIMIVKKKTRRIGAILLLVLAISTAAYASVKRIVDRDRPPYDFKPNIGLDYVPEQDVISELASSFPSGHATRSAAFALVVSYMVRNRSVGGIPAGMLMWIIPVSVGFSRMYMGAHYPTDVIAGILLGLIVANVMGKVLKFEAPR
ncbi:MAG: phosphatase PAP2 family protein [Nitrososphaerales archaeon]